MKRLYIFLLYGLLSFYLYGQKPNDPIHYVALDSIEAQEAWALTTGKPSISIAIVDRKFYIDNEDLKNKIDTICGVPGNESEHGTMVAGIAAAETNNGKGISSIGYNSRLGLYQFDLGEQGTDTGLVRKAILEAVKNGHRIINVSLHRTELSRKDVQDMTQKGIILVLAAGNLPDANSHVYIGDIPGVIIVSAVDSTGRFAARCAQNAQVDLCAPGNGLQSTYNNLLPYYPYNIYPATSFSAPFVAGTVALMLAVNPDLTAGSVERILKETSKSFLADDPYCESDSIGAGRLNAHAAVLGAIEKGTKSYKNWEGHLPLQEEYASSMFRLGNYYNDDEYNLDGYEVIISKGHSVFRTNYAVELYEGFSVLEDADLDIEILD